MDRVVPHAYSSPSCAHTPRWIPARSTTGATLASDVRRQRHRLLEAHRVAVVVGRHVGHRHLRHEPFFAPQAGPERGVDQALEHGDVGDRRGAGAVRGGRRGDMPEEIVADPGRDHRGGGIRCGAHRDLRACAAEPRHDVVLGPGGRLHRQAAAFLRDHHRLEPFRGLERFQAAACREIAPRSRRPPCTRRVPRRSTRPS